MAKVVQRALEAAPEVLQPLLSCGGHGRERIWLRLHVPCAMRLPLWRRLRLRRRWRLSALCRWRLWTRSSLLLLLLVVVPLRGLCGVLFGVWPEPFTLKVPRRAT